MTFKEYISNLRGKRVAVVGAGISNTPLIETLLLAGVSTLVCDKRSHDELGEIAGRFKDLGAGFCLGEHYLDKIDAEVIFRTPGLMPSHPAFLEAVRRGAVLTSEMEAFFEVCPCKTIGVTGSDGKTTTTSIIAELLVNEGQTAHLGGNIGTPLLCKADGMDYDDVAVVELSSFQLITMKKSPDISIITNLAPNHIDIHNDMDEYVEAKRNIFIWQRSTDTAVFNLDNEYTHDYAETAPGRVKYFSRRERVRDGVYLDNGKIYLATDGSIELIMPADEILLPGVHNIENFMAAFAAVQGLVGRDAMLETARTFRGVPHRIELVRELRGVRYYNDSIASSPTRTIAGLRAFDRKVILIAGGKDKGLSFNELGREAVSKVKRLVLTGLTAEAIRSAVINSPDYSGEPEILLRDDFTEAVITAAKSAQDGDVVLLSPACTSFDKFKNFEERGDLFKKIVKGLE